MKIPLKGRHWSPPSERIIGIAPARRATSLRAALAAAAVLLLMTALASTPAHAKSGEGISAGAADRHVAEILRLYPGSVRVSETSVLLEPGVVMTVPGRVSPSATMTVPAQGGGQLTVSAYDTSCSLYWVCMWEHINKGGYKLQFYYCGTYDLGSYAFPYGGTWRDRISSVYNHQTATAKFIDFLTLYPDASLLMGPGTYYPSLTYIRHPYSGSWNDKIDRVKPC
jgi:hypothetical protein